MSNRRKLPQIALAVKAVRKACHASQEGFAQQLGTTATSISRIERGLQTPAGFEMLNRLEKAARDLGMAEEASVLDNARSALRFSAYRSPERDDATSAFPLPQWRLAIAARVAAAYFPERLPAIQEALLPAIQIVDEVLQLTDENEIDYGRMEREVLSRAERRKLQELKREASNPQREAR